MAKDERSITKDHDKWLLEPSDAWPIRQRLLKIVKLLYAAQIREAVQIRNRVRTNNRVWRERRNKNKEAQKAIPSAFDSSPGTNS